MLSLLIIFPIKGTLSRLVTAIADRGQMQWEENAAKQAIDEGEHYERVPR
jgi:hypothetical protein